MWSLHIPRAIFLTVAIGLGLSMLAHSWLAALGQAGCLLGMLLLDIDSGGKLLE